MSSRETEEQVQSPVPTIEAYDHLRVADLMSRYEAAGHHEVLLRLPANPASLYGSIAGVRLAIHVEGYKVRRGALRRTSDSESPLMECWVEWATNRATEGIVEHPLNILGISAISEKGDLLPRPKVHIAGTRTVVSVLRAALAQTGSRLNLEFATTNACYPLPGRQPFKRGVLSLNIQFLGDDVGCILHIDHPPEISLRARIDNSEYHSLGQSAAPGVIRRISFFRKSTMKARYIWGNNEPQELNGPAVSLLTTGVSLIVAAFGVRMIQVQLAPLASAAFALSIAAPYIGILQSKRPFFPSADIASVTYDGACNLLSLPLYLSLMVITGVALGWEFEWRNLAMFLDVIAGIGLMLLGALYLCLVLLGFPQHYACDECEKQILVRRVARLHRPSRRTLCKECMAQIEQSPLPQEHR